MKKTVHNNFRDPQNLLIVHYDKLKKSMKTELERVMDFLEVENADIVCAIQNSEGLYHRTKARNTGKTSTKDVKDLLHVDIRSELDNVKTEVHELLKSFEKWKISFQKDNALY